MYVSHSKLEELPTQLKLRYNFGTNANCSKSPFVAVVKGKHSLFLKEEHSLAENHFSGPFLLVNYYKALCALVH